MMTFRLTFIHTQIISEEDDVIRETPDAYKVTADFRPGAKIDVARWNVLHFNTGCITLFIITCGVNSYSELVVNIKTDFGGDERSFWSAS